MKRFIGFVIAIAGIVALVMFKTFKNESGDVSLLQLFNTKESINSVLGSIKQVLQTNTKDSWLTLGVFAIAIIGLPLSLLLAGFSKKFGRFFWGLVAVCCCVFGSLIMFDVIFSEYSELFILVGKPYLGYFIAGGSGLVLMFMPIVFTD